jgi:heme/copper-type cytochrome/quinol oxidase subunit 4
MSDTNFSAYRITAVAKAAPILPTMRRYVIWYVLAVLWGAIAIAGLMMHHRTANAVLEGVFALLFAIIGIVVKRRDALIAARYTAKRPK